MAANGNWFCLHSQHKRSVKEVAADVKRLKQMVVSKEI